MEMETAGPCSKKRKLAELDQHESTAAAAEGQGPEPATEDQEPPLPAAGGGGEDRISLLPDDVLCVIISLLPTKEGACTQILASRWRHLWRSAPLNLDHHGLCRDSDDLGAVVSRILSAHPGPCRRFCAPVYHLRGDRVGTLRDRAVTADAWLRSPALRNLQELELGNWLASTYLMPPASPVAAFRFSETLCVAILGDCQLPNITDQAILFPKLKKLVLEQFDASESSLQTLIAGCLALECLLIAHGYGFRCVRINSISLRSICVQGRDRFMELIIENAPCLERLLQLIPGLHTSVISSTPKLETLGFLSSNNRLQLHSTVIQGLSVKRLAPEVPTVKILAIHMDALSLDATIELMRCFPCLERLYIECGGPGKPNLWRRKHQDFLSSFDICLKKISLRNYRGIKSHVDFTTFFVLNARVLELMTFQVDRSDYNEEYFAEQHKKLQLDSKASSGAQFHFTPDTSHRCVMEFRAHDLDLADPFERKDPYEFRALS